MYSVIWQLPVDRPFCLRQSEFAFCSCSCSFLCMCLCAFDILRFARCTSKFHLAFSRSLAHSLARCQQPAATIFGNFYVNRITHPTSTLKIHKYFSAVNREHGTTTHAHNGWLKSNEKKNTTHFNDNAMLQQSSVPATLKGCKSFRILHQWNECFSKIKGAKRKWNAGASRSEHVRRTLLCAMPCESVCALLTAIH